MATAYDVSTALRATLAGLSGYSEAQQTHAEHRSAPELDRSWSLNARETVTDVARARGVRPMVTRFDVAVAFRVRTPGPQRAINDAINAEHAISNALENTTGTDISGVRVTSVTRAATTDRAYYVIAIMLDCNHVD